MMDSALHVTILEERRFVRVRMAGPWTIDEICSQPEALLAECTVRKQKLLLIDFTELDRQPVTTLERYKLGMSTHVFSGKLERIAVAARPDFIDPERFGERVARNRGVNIRVFDDLENARRWLLEKDNQR